MNGTQLAKSYYDAYGAELLAQFPELQNKVAANCWPLSRSWKTR